MMILWSFQFVAASMEVHSSEDSASSPSHFSAFVATVDPLRRTDSAQTGVPTLRKHRSISVQSGVAIHEPLYIRYTSVVDPHFVIRPSLAPLPPVSQPGSVRPPALHRPGARRSRRAAVDRPAGS